MMTQAGDVRDVAGTFGRHADGRADAAPEADASGWHGGLEEELEDTQALPLPEIGGSESEIPRDRRAR
jgi:hypothetical protein